MTQPEKQPSLALTRPAIGVLVDPERMTAARKSAMLERIDLVALSQALDLIKIAEENGIDTGAQTDVQVLRKILADAGIDLTVAPYARRRIGVSRDEIAKLESRKGKRPKITTLWKLIDALNYARAQRNKPPLDVEDLQVPGEVLTKVHPLAREVPDPAATITDLGLSIRVRKKLYAADITTAGQLARRSSGELLAIPGLGVKGLDEIVAKIAALTAAPSEPRDEAELADWEKEVLDKQAEELSAIDAYQEASNDIYYTEKDAARKADNGTLPE